MHMQRQVINTHPFYYRDPHDQRKLQSVSRHNKSNSKSSFQQTSSSRSRSNEMRKSASGHAKSQGQSNFALKRKSFDLQQKAEALIQQKSQAHSSFVTSLFSQVPTSQRSVQARSEQDPTVCSFTSQEKAYGVVTERQTNQFLLWSTNSAHPNYRSLAAGDEYITSPGGSIYPEGATEDLSSFLNHNEDLEFDKVAVIFHNVSLVQKTFRVLKCNAVREKQKIRAAGSVRKNSSQSHAPLEAETKGNIYELTFDEAVKDSHGGDRNEYLPTQSDDHQESVYSGMMNLEAIEKSLQQFESISKSSMSPLLLRRKNANNRAFGYSPEKETEFKDKQNISRISAQKKDNDGDFSGQSSIVKLLSKAGGNSNGGHSGSSSMPTITLAPQDTFQAESFQLHQVQDHQNDDRCQTREACLPRQMSNMSFQPPYSGEARTGTSTNMFGSRRGSNTCVGIKSSIAEINLILALHKIKSFLDKQQAKTLQVTLNVLHQNTAFGVLQAKLNESEMITRALANDTIQNVERIQGQQKQIDLMKGELEVFRQNLQRKLVAALDKILLQQNKKSLSVAFQYWRGQNFRDLLIKKKDELVRTKSEQKSIINALRKKTSSVLRHNNSSILKHRVFFHWKTSNLSVSVQNEQQKTQSNLAVALLVSTLHTKSQLNQLRETQKLHDDMLKCFRKIKHHYTKVKQRSAFMNKYFRSQSKKNISQAFHSWSTISKTSANRTIQLAKCVNKSREQTLHRNINLWRFKVQSESARAERKFIQMKASARIKSAIIHRELRVANSRWVQLEKQLFMKWRLSSAKEANSIKLRNNLNLGQGLKLLSKTVRALQKSQLRMGWRLIHLNYQELKLTSIKAMWSNRIEGLQTQLQEQQQDLEQATSDRVALVKESLFSSTKDVMFINRVQACIFLRSAINSQLLWRIRDRKILQFLFDCSEDKDQFRPLTQEVNFKQLLSHGDANNKFKQIVESSSRASVAQFADAELKPEEFVRSHFKDYDIFSEGKILLDALALIGYRLLSGKSPTSDHAMTVQVFNDLLVAFIDKKGIKQFTRYDVHGAVRFLEQLELFVEHRKMFGGSYSVARSDSRQSNSEVKNNLINTLEQQISVNDIPYPQEKQASPKQSHLDLPKAYSLGNPVDSLLHNSGREEDYFLSPKRQCQNSQDIISVYVTENSAQKHASTNTRDLKIKAKTKKKKLIPLASSSSKKRHLGCHYESTSEAVVNKSPLASRGKRKFEGTRSSLSQIKSIASSCSGSANKSRQSVDKISRLSKKVEDIQSKVTSIQAHTESVMRLNESQQLALKNMQLQQHMALASQAPSISLPSTIDHQQVTSRDMAHLRQYHLSSVSGTPMLDALRFGDSRMVPVTSRIPTFSIDRNKKVCSCDSVKGRCTSKYCLICK